MAPPRLLKYVGVSLAVHVVAIVVVALQDFRPDGELSLEW